MDAGDFPVPRPAERLAVEGDVVPPAGVAGRQPGADDAVEVVGVEVPQDERQGGGGRRLAALEAEGVAEAASAESAELGDGGEAGVSGEDGHEAQAEDGHQRVLDAAGVARVLEFAQPFDQ